MDSYEDFAYVYDKLIGIDYKEYASFLEKVFNENCEKKPELILDLGCGTGSLTIELARRGYDMLGIDLSENMLAVANQKAIEENLDIRYICQDMRDFELYGTVDVILCTLDSINYITKKKDIDKMFSLFKNYLNPNGLFIFDINTIYKLSEILGNKTFVFDTGDVFFTWESEFNKKLIINNSYLNFFIDKKGHYNRFTETHIQKGYSVKFFDETLEKYGFEVISHLDFDSREVADEKSEKVIFVSKYLC